MWCEVGSGCNTKSLQQPTQQQRTYKSPSDVHEASRCCSMQPGCTRADDRALAPCNPNQRQHRGHALCYHTCTLHSTAVVCTSALSMFHLMSSCVRKALSSNAKAKARPAAAPEKSLLTKLSLDIEVLFCCDRHSQSCKVATTPHCDTHPITPCAFLTLTPSISKYSDAVLSLARLSWSSSRRRVDSSR